ncbi:MULTISPECIES: MalM family protein [Vibrio]|uniref:MalM family protein n=1 Tax=Vibrio TaxID=662 RepID=UPI0005AC8338|nr:MULTISPECIES: MalM family protein [Vibrio]EJU9539020.1 hypothetical protein [Vibrio alginolyticus]ELA8351637.1 hypothetical protein [Vibrio alginolyticus]ELA8471061.1 hypothetical protein [Vibrio alginolyticus]KIP65829.1 hypothetical protein SN12_23100 [Vibrio alginolyticus]MBO0200610.1 hypothetical protein [Vibrio alginolyticus]
MSLKSGLLLLGCSSILGGCASTSPEAYLAERQVLINKVMSSKACCTSISELEYTLIESGPSAEIYHINLNSQVFNINGDNSLVLALELPDDASRIEFRSMQTTSWDTTGGHFAPVVLQLDSDFNQISKDIYTDFSTNNAMSQWSGINGDLKLKSETKYLVFYTTQELLTQRTASYWSGSRSYEVNVPQDVLNKAPLYEKFSVGFTARPNTPDGKIEVHVCKNGDRSMDQRLSDTCI